MGKSSRRVPPDSLASGRTRIKIAARPIRTHNLVEHLSLLPPDPGSYGISVKRSGGLWNFTGQDGENHGLARAWSGIVAAVPEPGAAALVLVGVVGLVAMRRRRAANG